MTTTDLTALRFEGFTLDLAAYTLTDAAGQDVALRRSEFELLRAFLAAPGRALSRDHLLEAVASRHSEPFDRSVDVLVGRLRRKIEPEPGKPRLIVTVPGVGYRFAAKPQPVAAESDGAAEAAAATAPPTVPERRQVTVVQCGLCGPALIATRRDPEDLQRLLVAFNARCTAIIQRAGGTVTKQLDETVLAYFGYPETHEDAAERAIWAALRLIEAAGALQTGQPGALQVRAGIATGLVLVGDLFGVGSGEPGVLGEAPDLAAQLLASAAPGTASNAARMRRSGSMASPIQSPSGRCLARGSLAGSMRCAGRISRAWSGARKSSPCCCGAGAKPRPGPGGWRSSPASLESASPA
jgi:class 3 adenylate cyclase